MVRCASVIIDAEAEAGLGGSVLERKMVTSVQVIDGEGRMRFWEVAAEEAVVK